MGHYYLDIRRHTSFFIFLLTKTLYCATLVGKGFLLYFFQDTFRLGNHAGNMALLSNVAIAGEVSAALSAAGTMLLLDGAGSGRTPADAVQAGARMCRWAVGCIVLGALWMGFFWLGVIALGNRVQATFPDAGAAAVAFWAPFVWVGAGIWGLGQGVYLAGDQSVSYVLIPDPEEASRYLGFASLCSFTGAIFGGGIASVLLVAFGGGAPSGYTLPGYVAVYLFCSVLSVILTALACLIKIPQGGPQPAKPKYGTLH